MFRLSTEYNFDAAHFLQGYDGKCKNIHGHRWKVVVEVQSEQLRQDRQQREMCIDFSILKEDLKDVAGIFDHKFIVEKNSLKDQTMTALREEGFEMAEIPFRPTAENFARFFYDRMVEKGYDVYLVSVYETPKNCAMYGINL